MIYIKTKIQNIECDTETDECVMRLLQGTLYKTGNWNQYYLYCEEVLLNDKVCWGKIGKYEGPLPTVEEVAEDMIDNFSEEHRKLTPELGNEDKIPRKITRSITLLPLESLVEIFISEINKSKVEISNAIIFEKKPPSLRFEGCTYRWNLHDNIIIQMVDDEIPEYDNFFVQVNPGDQVFRKKTDSRGYPPSCGVENKDMDVIMIVKGISKNKADEQNIKPF